MFLGIDLGTSELKALLLDEQHRTLASVGEALQVQRPHPNWSEQHPHDWWAACMRALERLAQQQPAAMAAVQAIGLSGQMHGAVLLDEHDTVLRPAMLWNDGRSAAQCAQLHQQVPELERLTGNLAMPGFTAPKLLWVREHEPDVFARTRSLLLPKDWLRLQLTGECVSEMSDASGTLWLDVGARRWSQPMLAACSLEERHMPRLVEGTQPTGGLRAQWATRCGVRTGTPVAGGGGDNAASAVGMGAVHAGQGFVSLGTSGVVFLAASGYAPHTAQAVHTFCHALPHSWHHMAVMLSAASALRWACQLLGGISEHALLHQVAELSDTQRARAPLFLPYLSGERTPHNDAHARGVLFGLSHDHSAASVGHAVIEGVAFGLADGWQAMGGPSSGVTTLSLVGGGARSALWAQMIADTLNVRLLTHADAGAGAALGAARLAWLSVGGLMEAVCPPPAVLHEHVPQPEHPNAQMLMERHARYAALYPALREPFAAR